MGTKVLKMNKWEILWIFGIYILLSTNPIYCSGFYNLFLLDTFTCISSVIVFIFSFFYVTIYVIYRVFYNLLKKILSDAK